MAHIASSTFRVRTFRRPLAAVAVIATLAALLLLLTNILTFAPFRIRRTILRILIAALFYKVS